MRKLAALVVVASLLPGCSLVGMAIGGSRATAHNDEVARRLQRGERVDPDDQQQSVSRSEAVGFALGAVIDVALTVAVVSSRYSNVNNGTGIDGYTGR